MIRLHETNLIFTTVEGLFDLDFALLSSDNGPSLFIINNSWSGDQYFTSMTKVLNMNSIIILYVLAIHISNSKQCRPISDATECGI